MCPAIVCQLVKQPTGRNVANLETKPPVGANLVHEVVFYRGRDQLERTARQFVEEGLAAGEPVLIALPRESLELLTPSLDPVSTAVAFEDLTRSGSNPGRMLPLFQDWADHHRGRVRVLGEPVWPGRNRAETVEGLRHESLVNIALADANMAMRCLYDAERLDADVLSGAEATHPLVVEPDGTRSPSPRYVEPPVLHRPERWPLEPPPAELATRVFEGDLWGLRRFVAGDERVVSLSEDRRHQLLLAVNEAATNALKHGGGRFEVKIWRDGAGVVSEVKSGGWFDDPLAGLLRPPKDAVSGRGLWLINQLCDMVELRSAEPATTVRMHMYEAG
jgi:anti-sigma regulatory factor (Ser/Thr protein kinase)